MAFPTFTPALRLVNSSGSVIAGPLALGLPSALAQGIFLGSTDCEYVPEMIGPFMNLAYSQRFTLLGYRPKVTFRFPLVMVDGASGLANLYSYYTGAFVGGTYAALQVNLFYGSSNVWRGMIPTSTWSPKAANGKQRAGYEIDLALDARDLITAPGDWSAGTW